MKKIDGFVCFIILSLSIILFSYGIFNIKIDINKKFTFNNYTHPVVRLNFNDTKLFFETRCVKYDELFKGKNQTKIILILIDGLPHRFLSMEERDSLKMKKLKKMIYEKKFNLFKSFCSYPTFTLSGMKRLFTGRGASFLDSLFNLGSSSIPGDTLFNKLKENGKKTLTLGDYLIFSWFPNMFVEDSIKTITTTDLQYFNDVDRKTGEYIDYAIKEKYLKWDFLFIYFLGLDQGGHFLNSDNDELMKMKLDELDDYVVKIYNDMSMKDENFIIIVTGDHGMTRHGSHGGSDRTETESAFLISFNNKMFNEKFDNNFINQIDITPTILNLFGIDRTSDSIGITYDFTFNFFERSYVTISNLKYLILNFNLDDESLIESNKCIEAIFNEIDNNCKINNTLNDNLVITKCESLVKKLQRPYLINTATPNHVPVHFGFVLAIIGACYFIYMNIEDLKYLHLIIFIITTLFFMGSSFIDEASDVWFFLLQTLLVLFIIISQTKFGISNLFQIMLLNSIMRGFMQHVHRRFLISENTSNVLGEGRWLKPLLNDTIKLNNNIYSNEFILLISVVITIFLFQKKFQQHINFFSGYIFISFTLIKLFSINNKLLLIALYVIPLTITLVSPNTSLKVIYKIFCITYLFTPTYLVIYLSVLLYTLKIFLSNNEIAPKNIALTLSLLIEASFFFNGTLLTFSSLDLSVTSIALIHDNIISMALRLFIHTFSSYLLIYGFILNEIFEKNIREPKKFINYLSIYNLTIRILSLLVSELSLIIFQNHIMIWSTFAPKYIIDISLIFLSLILNTFIYININ